MAINVDTLNSTEQEIYWAGYTKGWNECDTESRLNQSQQLLAIKRLPDKKSVDRYIDTFINNMRK